MQDKTSLPRTRPWIDFAFLVATALATIALGDPVVQALPNALCCGGDNVTDCCGCTCNANGTNCVYANTNGHYLCSEAGPDYNCTQPVVVCFQGNNVQQYAAANAGDNSLCQRTCKNPTVMGNIQIAVHECSTTESSACG